MFNHPAVAECVAFAVPDERLGEEVGAALYLREGAGLGAGELRDYLRQHLAAYKIPRYIWFVDAPLPRNANGKFVKRDIREKLDLEQAG